MSDKYWGWCPSSDVQKLDYDLEPYGFSGTASVTESSPFAVVTYKHSDIPEELKIDVSYRIYLRFLEDAGGDVPPEIAPRLFPVPADEMADAADTIIDGIDQINKYFFSVMKMNEYRDDIGNLMELGLKVLDYFIDNLELLRGELGEAVEGRMRELRFKRSYMQSLQMHLYS